VGQRLDEGVDRIQSGQDTPYSVARGILAELFARGSAL